MKPFISIIIPVFKARDYIEDCLQSVYDQDYQGPVECILVDDCSPDDSIDIAKKFIDKHSKDISFRIICQDTNRKQSAARNRGMLEAKGDYIYFLDSDDWLDPSALSRMVNLLEKYPDCQMIQAGISRTDETIFPWLDCDSWNDHMLEFTSNKQWITDTCSARFEMIPMTPVSKLMNRKFLEDNKFRFHEGIFHEDEIWLVLLAKYLQSVAFCHHNLYHYRIHEGSTTDGGQVIHYDAMKSVWIETFKLFDKSFCPPRMLKQIDFDTSHFFEHKNIDNKTRWMLIGIKLRLMHYCKPRTRLRLAKWILLHLKDFIY